ncbi:GntR family transcriptional regulator [Dactylosporangium sp. CS-033363]|uniref:GntR family transcriptional regulator n=1 Tax=Dactylosporangium sp. CS-033363 TaxID=3239935 RepID=UPI003D8FEE93
MDKRGRKGQARYRHIADAIRERIYAGEYVAGLPLPSEALLTADFGVSLMTVRRALAVLREEGLIATKRGRVARVRKPPPRRRVVLPAGATLVSRMPSDDERARLSIERGVPLLEIRYADGTVAQVNAETVEVVSEENTEP